MWNMYLDEVKEDDQRITDAWKEDANGLLVFVSLNVMVSLFVSMTNLKTGLFSATVGAFIIEFYKQLSPDSGSLTVNYLDQISKQIGNFPSGNYSYAPISSPPPSASIVLVNAMWMISLVLSLTSALIATLLQQWARRYVETPKVPSEPKDRARVRWFLFLGTDFYKMRLLVEIAPTLLHLSVYLFFAGLVVTFHTINKKVAIAVDVSVGVFGLAYVMLSILPCLDVKCPYRTPMSYILWYPCHIFLSFTAHCIHWLVKRLHECFVEPSPDGIISSPRQRKLVKWIISRENAIKKHWRYLIDGFRKSVINDAINAQEGDNRIITWLFGVLSLSDKTKLRKLAAGIPRDKTLNLIRPTELGSFQVIREPLAILLRSSVAGTGATGPDEDVRKRSLFVCLDAIHPIAKASTIPDLTFVRVNFANIGLMRTLWNDSDTTIRFISRSICALVARQVIRGSLEEPQLRWLQEVTGETSNTIYNANIATRDRMNFKSFVYGVLSSSNQAGGLPTESFKETLAILLGVRTSQGTEVYFDMTAFENRLFEELEWLQQDDPQPGYDVVKSLREIALGILVSPSPLPYGP